MGALAPGEEKTIEFPVIGIASGESVTLPLAAVANLGDQGRRVGALEINPIASITNDYKLMVQSAPASLRMAGLTRVMYTVQNISSGLLLKSMQLKISFSGENKDEFVVIGPNPQFLNPLLQNESLSFEVPVMVQTSNGGGVMRLELSEDGRSVLINQTNF